MRNSINIWAFATVIAVVRGQERELVLHMVLYCIHSHRKWLHSSICFASNGNFHIPCRFSQPKPRCATTQAFDEDRRWMTNTSSATP